MESELSPDKERNNPPVPIKTYQWEDLRRAREVGRYPWTHLLKVPLEGEITAEDIIRETTPRRSMSREFSRSRTRSPDDMGAQRILNLDSSPGSSRKHGEDGEDEGVHIPNFSQEVSVESEDDAIDKAVKAYVDKQAEPPTGTELIPPVEIKANISPKSILKRRVPEQNYIGVTETREKTKCCHPLVNKIKHLADKTLHKLEKNEGEKSPLPKRKKNEAVQEIRQLKNSPGAVRRQKFGGIKLGDSDEVSKSLCADTPPPTKKKEHIYEDIEDKKNETEKTLYFSSEIKSDGIAKKDNENQKENENIAEKKSNTSQDPSLVVEDATSLKSKEFIMEKLHKTDEVIKEAVLLDDEMESEEPNVEEIFQNQLDEVRAKNDSPNITITEIFDDDLEAMNEQHNTVPIETSPSPSPQVNTRKRNEDTVISSDWSKPSSDHEYEIIEKPATNVIFSIQNEEEKPECIQPAKTDDELSSTTSLERKYLLNTSDEEEHNENTEKTSDYKDEDLINAENLQRDIEGRFFVSTPSSVSRTECEISTSQVDSSALENLPLRRGSRTENRIQQRIKEGTGKLKTQAGKLKTKLQNIKTKQFTLPERPKINFPERPKIRMPDRPKFSFPDRPKFTLPDRRRFSLPERPKFKKINISEKLHLGDHKFTFSDRPKFNVPDLSKLKMPERPKMFFSSVGRKKDCKIDTAESSSDCKNKPTVEFEAKTYPRLFGRKKKTLPKTSSSPTLDRENTPPATFVFTRVRKTTQETSYQNNSEQPREYGTIETEGELISDKHFETTYDFDKIGTEYLENTDSCFNGNRNAISIPDVSASNQEYTHINELNHDEFFVRPRGISRENIQVREYLSDEIRQAFRIPKNVLADMGSNSGININMYINEPEADPELLTDNNEPIRYSTEDLNDKDDGYYTFPPIRPSRIKRKKKKTEQFQYIDDNTNLNEQFNDVDLCLSEDQDINAEMVNNILRSSSIGNQLCPNKTDLHSIHEYANDDVNEYPENIPIQSQTLPMPPTRKKKLSKHSLTDLKNLSSCDMWEGLREPEEDIIIYRTEHEYITPQADTTFTEQSPLAPRRNRSRSSRGTSFCDDDRTSHGAESLTLDTQMPHIDTEKQIRHESPGYATVDKSSHVPSKGVRRSASKTPPVRRRKSNSSERKYYTVGPSRPSIPDRPPRKKSSTSLMTLDDGFNKRSISTDLTQYVEIDSFIEDSHKDLKSGDIVNKMKDRPLPPPPRPPRGSKKVKKTRKSTESNNEKVNNAEKVISVEAVHDYSHEPIIVNNIAEIEVSTQTDPLPDDIDYELGMEENLDISMSSSLRDIVNEDSINEKSYVKITESPHVSRPTSRSDKSLKLSDPKITELSRSNVGRTSPTVILVERRVSSPTRINEREEMLTEASLTVQHIDIDESHIPDVPPLPKPREVKPSKNIVHSCDDRALERITETSRDVVLDNLVTQRLQVSNLDVGRLNVSELQASKIMVSDIEGMTLQVTELDSKSGHISVSGIEFSQSVIDEIVKKFTEITTNQITSLQEHPMQEIPMPLSREEHTQTDVPVTENANEAIKQTESVQPTLRAETQHASSPSHKTVPPPPPPRPGNVDDATSPPQRPPPPDLTPLLYSYLQDITSPPTSFYTSRSLRERPFAEFYEPHQSPPPPNRRSKKRLAAPHSETSSEDERPRPSPRRMAPPIKTHEPTITEAGAQFLRVCQNSISRTLRHIINSFMSYLSGTEDKKDMQMALVIFLVLVAGLIMFGLSDSRTIHHHHWEFFNPPDGKQ